MSQKWRLLLEVLLLFSIGGVVLFYQLKIADLEKENGELSKNLDVAYEAIGEVEKIMAMNEDFEAKIISKDQMLDKVNSIFLRHIEFYSHSYDFKDIRIMQVNDQTFDVSYLAMTNKRNHIRQWDLGVSRIILLDGGNYDLKITKGPLW